MKDTKKGRPDALPSGQPTDHNSQHRKNEPQMDCTTPSADGQGRVSRYLRHGAENATSTHDLVQLVGCDTVRQLQDFIREERKNGVLILSTSGGRGGYYLPSADPQEAREEINRFVSTLLARASNTFKTAQIALNNLSVADGQMRFDNSGIIRGCPQPWGSYEMDKTQFEDKGISPDEYTMRVRYIADERGL